MNLLIWIYTVCPLVFELVMCHSFDEAFIYFADSG